MPKQRSKSVPKPRGDQSLAPSVNQLVKSKFHENCLKEHSEMKQIRKKFLKGRPWY